MHTDERTSARVRLLHGIFEEQARATPNAVAIDVPPLHDGAPRRQLTYALADAAAEALAGRLAAHVREECLVAVLLPRPGTGLFVAQLAILKAGAAWTCIEPATPAERLRFLIQDSRAVAAVTDEAGGAALESIGFPRDRILVLREPGPEAPSVPVARVEPAWLRPESLAYVIYTSGTTGHPKGVMIEHHSVANLVLADAEYFDLRPGDRVAQTSSAAYDSSVEEIWLAWATGATVVVVDDERVRSGPDLLPWLRAEEITVWCPAPTLLRMAASDEPQRDLPNVRLLYVGGEELTPDVAQRWAPGRRLENGYGPTECTVTVVRTPVHAGRPVAIGRPIPGNRAFVVDAELREVATGESGELCIAGESVARGYLGRPDLTAERFLEHPRLGRIYRTGDLVRQLPDGALAYLGRADTQVKIRGHRIELTAVESELCRYPGIQDAACRVQADGIGPELVAFVVMEGPAVPDREAIGRWLRRTLPEPMVPSRIHRLDSLPRAALSGKLDRAALPELPHEDRSAPAGRAPANAAERAVATAFAHQLRLPHDAPVEADFFLDLGGNSLLAAQVVSELRQDPRTASLTVRDLYETRTVAGLAARIPASPQGASRVTPAPTHGAKEIPRVSRHAAWGAAVQCAFLALSLLAAVNAIWLAVFRLVPAIVNVTGALVFWLLLPALGLVAGVAWTLVAALLTLGAKRILIGRYAPGRHPYLGQMYVRHWIVAQLARSFSWDLLESTGLRIPLLRALGARIGARVHLHRGVAFQQGGWDLLEIGAGAALGRDVAVGLVTHERQQIVFASVAIGAQATLDTRARMAGGSRLGPGAFLAALSWLPEGAEVPAGEKWDGVPARPAGQAPPSPAASCAPERPSGAQRSALLAARGLALLLPFLPWMAVAAVVLRSWRGGGVHAFAGLPLLALAGAVVGGYALSLPLQALLCRGLGRVPPGVHPIHGAVARTVFLKERIVETANVALAGTLAWPVWLRWAGMRVGQRCEISTIMEATPELVEVADDCFLADGIYLGRPLVHRGHLHCERTALEPRTFIGNHAVVPAGSRLPPDILLGVCTVADPERIQAGTGWFGHPAFLLPRREAATADERLTHNPSRLRWANRALWESARLVLPVLPAFLATFWITELPRLASAWSAPAVHLGLLPLAALATAAFLCALTVAVKWLLLGRAREARHVLWSTWCCRWDFLFEVWSAYARPVVEALEGTPLVSWWLRAMGARIGRRVVFGTSVAQVVDPDMIDVDDDATVSCHLQLHSFEDRVLKLERSHIGAGSNLAPGSLLLYGARIEPGAHVAEQSVVMKHERLLRDQAYEGAPTRPVGA